MRGLILGLLAPLAVLAENGTCYYSNGDVSTDTYPCGGDSPMCCPNNNICLNNGLCHLPDQKHFGRYTCAESPWGVGCPKNCLETDNGNEGVIQCDDGTWCCNGNSHDKDDGERCCDKKREQRRVFQFGGGNMIAIITGGKAKPTTGVARGSISEPPPQSTTTTVAEDGKVTSTMASTGMVAGSAIANSRSLTAPTSSLTGSVGTATTTKRASEGQPLPATSATTAEATTITISDSAANTDAAAAVPGLGSNTVIGMAVGIPACFAAICIIAFLFWRNRRAQRRIRPQTPPEDFTPVYPEKTNPSNGYTAPANYPGKAPSEIDSREVRIPISPQDTSHMAVAGAHMQRDQTTNTLYPNAQPNYANPVSPATTYTGPGTPSILSNPSQNFDEWAVTPRLQQHQLPRWSGPTAQDGGVGVSPMIGGGSQASNGSQHGQGNQREAHELMGRPQIPTTIAELE